MNSEVLIVTADAQSALAHATAAALKASSFAVRFSDARLSTQDAMFLLLEDAALPDAMRRLIAMMPGTTTFSNVVLVTPTPENAGGLLAEGFRDIVRAEDAARATESALSGEAPVFLSAVRRDIVSSFIPHNATLVRERAERRKEELDACIALLRASNALRAHVDKLHATVARQTLDGLIVMRERADEYLRRLTDAAARIEAPALLEAPARLLSPLNEREPRMKNRAQFLDDIYDDLVEDGLGTHMSQDTHRALLRAGEESAGKPLRVLSAWAALIEGELNQRLSGLAAKVAADDQRVTLQRDCLDRYDFTRLPPGIVLPSYIASLIRMLWQPPLEVYLTWVLDLRDMKLKTCSHVIDEIQAALRTQAPDEPAV